MPAAYLDIIVRRKAASGRLSVFSGGEAVINYESIQDFLAAFKISGSEDGA